jgi:YidC/Oxa1 family membrane protein insertase
MDQKRFVLFMVLSMGVLFGWPLLMQRLMPPKAKPAVQKVQQENQGDKAGDNAGDHDLGGDRPQLADRQAEVGPGQADDEAPSDETGLDNKPLHDNDQAAIENPEGDKPAAKEKPAGRDLPKFPEKTVELGSSLFQPDKGYRQLVTLSSRGAAVKSIQLNDPRYVTLVKPHQPLTIVGTDVFAPDTLEYAIPQMGIDVRKENWELVEVLPNLGVHSAAVFRLEFDDIVFEKKYELPEVDPQAPKPEAGAYSMKVELTFRNRGKRERIINYVLQGPTGLPLENVENTQKFRDVVVGFQTPRGGIDHQLMAGKTIAEGKVEEWKEPMKFIGVDVQFFAALLSPGEDQSKTAYTRSATQQLVGPDKKEKSDISVELTSVDLKLAKANAADDADRVTHTYHLFAGPKRDDVLPAGSEKVIDFGMFHWISRPMLGLLKIFHRLSGSWGIAVICLTIVVRSAMFPVSIKQARGAAKMQAIQPEIAALKEKYGNDKEKFGRAQMELYRKHNFNPFAGCIPILFQLPIFMGLYQSLNHAVDLRMAHFLWIDNLAAPDALFQLPFAIPFLGPEFNLLPIITVILYVVQQKMFTPPPANEEQAMQQKMMSFMMIFMGVMFYKVPAGLCVYFIASSLWSMAERKLLPKAKPAAVPLPPPGPTGRRKKNEPEDDDSKGGSGGGLWTMLLKAAEKETSARRGGDKRR